MSAIPLREPSKPCIGRDRELAVLRRQFEQASQRGERLTLIRGSAGVGKTRLMVEFRSQMRLDGAVVLEGRCTSGARALAPIREIFHRALAFLDDVGRVGDVDLEPLAFLLNDGAPELPISPNMTRLEQRVQFFEAYCSLLRGLSRIKPPIIILHDLQWADRTTLEMLNHLIDGAGPWLEAPQDERTMLGLIVATVREEEAPGTVRQLSAHPKADVIELAGFDESAMVQFLQSPEVVERLMRVTGGNPDEVLSILETPAIGADRMLQRRLEFLAPDSRKLLAAQAALGRPTEANLVARVAGVGSAAQPLAELIDSGLVVKSVESGEVVLRPARHRYGEVTYAALDESDRRGLHQRIAKAFRGARGLAAQDVAYHAIRAGDCDAAVESSLEASTALEHNLAYEAATNLLEQARPLASAHSAIEVNRRLADLYSHTGAYKAALQCAQALCEALPGDAAALLMVAKLQALSGDYDGASTTLGSIAVPSEGELSHSFLEELVSARAEICFRLGNYEEALDECRACSLDSRSAAALNILNTRGKVELARGEYKTARRTFESNLSTARTHDLLREQSQALINLGIVSLREHEHKDATRHLDEALELARKIGALRESAIALENLAVLAHFRRDYGNALDCYHSAVGDLKKLGNRSMLARAANNLGELYLRLGDGNRAAKLADFSRHVAGENPPQSIVAEGSLLEARIAVQSGDARDARLAFIRATEIFERLGEKTRALEAEIALARLDVQHGEVTEARSTLDRLLAGDGLDQVLRGEAAMLEADLESATFGNPLRAVLVAIDCFERAEDPERAWRAHFRASLVLRVVKDDTGAQRHLERAATMEAQIAATVPPGFIEGLNEDRDRRRLHEALAEQSDNTEQAAQPVQPSQQAPASAPRREATVTTLRPPPRPERRSAPPTRDESRGALFPRIVFNSPAMHQALDLVERVAATDSIVLIRGESGTGKELIADAIHRISARKNSPFVKVNCAALVETLLLSELFGHEKGAFTGALQRRKGRFEAADGGTLFLDEIGDISAKTQVSLLRVLQEQQFERVGGSKPLQTDVRIICATNRNLETLVREGTFREDLYYRLKGIQVSLPPLRERRSDVELLANHFLALAAEERNEAPPALDDYAVTMLQDHPWPGNVRELENVMRSASLFADGPTLGVRQLSEFTELAPSTSAPTTNVEPITRAASAPPPPPPVNPMESLCSEVLRGDLSLAEMKKMMEQQAIEAALRQTNGNITQAASLLGMKRPRLSQLVKEHGLMRREGGVKS